MWSGGGGGGGGGSFHTLCTMCVCAGVYVCCFGGADGFIPLTMLVDACQCCHLLMFINYMLTTFRDLFLVKLGE